MKSLLEFFVAMYYILCKSFLAPMLLGGIILMLIVFGYVISKG